MGFRRLQIGALLLLGAVARVLIFDDVGVNGDTGLYLYDAKQLLWGRQMFVEFPSRSPVFEHALAAVIHIAPSPLHGARAFMVVVGVALGAAVYGFASQLHSHRAGLVAAAIFLFTPFTLVWGLWLKTEQAAGLLVLTAFIVALSVIDRDRLPAWAFAVIGTLFGLAFLVRRVAIVHIGAFAIFVVWYRYRHHGDLAPTVAAAGSVVAAAAATLAAAYLLLARGDLSLAYEIFETHAVALISSSGQGSLGWVHLESARAITAESRPGMLAQVCQKCGMNTVVVFISTLLVTLPGVLPLLAFARSYFDTTGFVGEVILPVSLIVPALYALSGLLVTPYWSRAVAAGLLVTTVAVLWRTRAAPFDEWWRPAMLLPVVVLIGLTAGYLYRDRIIYVTYFQDFYPYVATLSGITLVAWYDRLGDVVRLPLTRRRLVAVGLMILASSSVVAGFNAYPYIPPSEDDEQNPWFSIELADAYGSDIDRRVPPDSRVLTAQPLYVIESERQIVGDLSRKYYLFRGWPEDSLTADVERKLVEDVRHGDVQYAIVDSELRAVFNESPQLEAAVREEFEPVPDAQVYNLTDATMYRRASD